MPPIPGWIWVIPRRDSVGVAEATIEALYGDLSPTAVPDYFFRPSLSLFLRVMVGTGALGSGSPYISSTIRIVNNQPSVLCHFHLLLPKFLSYRGPGPILCYNVPIIEVKQWHLSIDMLSITDDSNAYLYLYGRSDKRGTMKAGIEAFYTELGRRIQHFRTQRSLTQEQLGRALKPQVTRASIANLETGKQRVLAHTLVQLAQALEVPLQDLVLDVEHRAAESWRQGDIESELAQELALPKSHIRRLVSRLKNEHRRGKK